MLAGADGESYNAHPLMKLAFSQWFDGDDRRMAHRHWAEAAEGSPALAGSPKQANSLEELRPWLDVVEHYLDAGAVGDAWGVYRGREVDRRLMYLGHAALLLELGQRFEAVLEAGDWRPAAGDRISLYNYLGHACNGLGRGQEDLEYTKKQYTSARETQRKEQIVAAGAILADTHLNLGDLYQAQALLAELGATVERVNDRDRLALFRSVQAMTALLAGEYSRALDLYQDTLKPASTHNRYLIMSEIGDALTRSGHLERAWETLNQALRGAEWAHLDTLI